MLDALDALDAPYVTLPRLRQRRLVHCLTRRQLATRAQVGETTLARIEGGRPARAITAVRIAAALHVTVRDLASAAEDPLGSIPTAQ
jgi:transcriptional regulator with XRE-family HTH domain